YGSCRLCLVEVKGRGLVTACTTRVEDGMEVLTETEQVREARREVLRMMAKRYPPTAVPNRALELMKRYGVEPEGAENPRLIDERHPWIKVDLSRCVLCYNIVGDLASPAEQREEILAALYRVPFVATVGPVAGTTAQSASKVHLLAASHAEEEGVYMAVDGTLRLARGTRANAMRAWEVMAALLSRLGHWRRYGSAAEAWDELRSLVPWLSGATYERLSAGPLRVSPGAR
ncbi:MAG: 2Fe-2S iron-sulfur cluster-binding protein, partial [Thermoprotei archaeon]